jgi:hypothetical protein
VSDTDVVELAGQQLALNFLAGGGEMSAALDAAQRAIKDSISVLL